MPRSLSGFASEHHNGKSPSCQNRKEKKKKKEWRNLAQCPCSPLVTVPSSYMELLESILSSFLIPRLGEERVLGGVQTLREFLLGLLFQMCFRAIAYLPEYVWASYKNNKVNSQPPSFRGSYFLNVFYEPP